MPTVLIRTFIIYVLLLVSMKLMGKRQVGELELSELITTFMLSELAVIPISDKNIPLAYAVFPILLLLSLEVIFSFCITKINILKKLFYGKPSFLIAKGTVDQRELERLRISLDELLSELRQKDIADISDVDYAILEDNGKLSVIRKGCTGYAHPIIIDGELIDDEMKKCRIDRAVVEKWLSPDGLSPCDVFLLTVDDRGKISLIAKSKGGGK